jgi:hypothetical protein
VAFNLRPTTGIAGDPLQELAPPFWFMVHLGASLQSLRVPWTV